MFELCHAGRVASMALRDGGMIMEAWAVTVHGKATRSRIENILIAETAKRDLEGCACGAGEYLAKSKAKPEAKILLIWILFKNVLSPGTIGPPNHVGSNENKQIHGTYGTRTAHKHKWTHLSI